MTTTNERDELARLAYIAKYPLLADDAAADWDYIKANTLQPEARALGESYRIADAVLAEYVLVRRSDLPETHESTHGNGICTALAQEFYQPELRFSGRDGDKPGEWNRRIAYANLAVALAIETPDAAL